MERRRDFGRLYDLERLLKLAQVKEATAMGKTTIYALMDAGAFPRPFRAGRQAVRWRQSEILQWIDSLPRSTGWLGSE